MSVRPRAGPTGPGLAAALGLALTVALPLTTSFPSPAWSQAAPRLAAEKTVLTAKDIQAGLARLEALGRFFGAFATRDTNGFARERWHRLSLGYPGTAALLRDLMARDLLLIEDLPDGRVSGLLDHGEIVIDSDLDGQWLPTLLKSDGDRAEATARRLDRLTAALIEALARRQPPQDWPWLADHLRAVGGFGRLAQDPLARPLLARFFHAKDTYLWLAMQRIGTGDPPARLAFARRQAEIFEATRGLATDLAATFGAEPGDRLQHDWAEYVAQVDGFAVTRGWLLLDPTLRRTQLGAAAQGTAGAIGEAAADVVASSPRSAVAAARADAAAPRGPGRPAGERPGVSLGDVVSQSRRADIDALAATLPLQALALQPETAISDLSEPAYRTFATKIKKAMAQPQPREALAEREGQLGEARQQVAALKAHIDSLGEKLVARAKQAGHQQAALADERARASVAEQQVTELESRLAAEQAAKRQEAARAEAGRQAAEEKLAAAQRRLAEVEGLLADQQAVSSQNASRQAAAQQALEAELTTARQRLTATEEQLAALHAVSVQAAAQAEADRQTAADKLSASEQRLADVRSELAALQAASAKATAQQQVARQAAEAQAAAAEQRVSEIEDRLTALQVGSAQAIAQQEAERQAAEKNTSSAEQRLAELKDRMTELQVSSAQAAARQEAARQAAETKTSDAAQRVSEVEDRLAALQASSSQAIAQQEAARQAAEQKLAAAERRLGEVESRLTTEQTTSARKTAQQQIERQVLEEKLQGLQQRLAEVEAQVTAQQALVEAQAGKLAAARQAAARAESDAAAAKAARNDGGSLLDRISPRELLVIAVVVALLVLGLVLWLWLRSHRGVAGAARAPLLLTAELATARQTSAVAAPVADEPEAPAPPVEVPMPRESRPRVSATAGAGARVNGITPPTAEAKAAMKAAGARREAARAAEAADAAADPGYGVDAAGHPIVQALREGNLPLFEMLFGELTDLRAPQLQRIVYGGRGEDLAIVCRAVGVDKQLFGSIYTMTEHLRGSAPEEEPERTKEILRMYDRMPASTARKVLMKWQRNWSGQQRREPVADA